MKLTRYWFEFEVSSEPQLPRRFGVTAWSYEDALTILRNPIPIWNQLQLKHGISDVDIQALDPNHVLPNMGTCSVRGIWFPKGYQ
jgi:hypothetical protein